MVIARAYSTPVSVCHAIAPSTGAAINSAYTAMPRMNVRETIVSVLPRPSGEA